MFLCYLHYAPIYGIELHHSAWSAWFPFVFYVTVYIGDLYKLSLSLPESDGAADELDKEATIIGTRASFYFSIVTLTANFVMPSFTKGEKGSARGGDT